MTPSSDVPESNVACIAPDREEAIVKERHAGEERILALDCIVQRLHLCWSQLRIQESRERESVDLAARARCVERGGRSEDLRHAVRALERTQTGERRRRKQREIGGLPGRRCVSHGKRLRIDFGDGRRGTGLRTNVTKIPALDDGVGGASTEQLVALTVREIGKSGDAGRQGLLWDPLAPSAAQRRSCADLLAAFGADHRCNWRHCTVCRIDRQHRLQGRPTLISFLAVGLTKRTGPRIPDTDRSIPPRTGKDHPAPTISVCGRIIHHCSGTATMPFELCGALLVLGIPASDRKVAGSGEKAPVIEPPGHLKDGRGRRSLPLRIRCKRLR